MKNRKPKKATSSTQSRPGCPEHLIKDLGLAIVEQAVWDLKYAQKYGTRSAYPEDLMTKQHFAWFFNKKNELWHLLGLNGDAICDRLRPVIAGLK